MKRLSLIMAFIFLFILCVPSFALTPEEELANIRQKIADSAETAATAPLPEHEVEYTGDPEEVDNIRVVTLPETVYNNGRTAIVEINLGKSFAGTKISFSSDCGTDPNTYVCDENGIVRIETTDVSSDKFVITAIDSINKDLNEATTENGSVTVVEIVEDTTKVVTEKKGEKKDMSKTTMILFFVGCAICATYLVVSKVMAKKKTEKDNVSEPSSENNDYFEDE